MVFPHYRYHRDGRHVLVRSPAHLEEIGAGWHPYPVSQLSEEEYAALGALVETPRETSRDIPETSRETPETPPVRICKLCGEPGHHAGHCPQRFKPRPPQ
jgi:hypothetical protein